jgi:uncharacterized Ntn-hydrolase superfamily protein
MLIAAGLLPSSLFGTWSLGVIDPVTKTIAVAGASCTNSVYGIAGVVPGSGLVFAQAASNMRAKAEAMRAIRRDVPAGQILKRIASPAFDRNYGRQQYAILTVAEIDSPATFTGNDTTEWRGVRVTRGISVQGNTLVSSRVVQAAFDSLVRARWTDDAGLARAVASALAAGSAAGGDKRCGEATASSAFLTVVRSRDSEASPFLNLVVTRADAHGRNAVTLLQERLNSRQRKLR